MTPSQSASSVDTPAQHARQPSHHRQDIPGFGTLGHLKLGSAKATNISPRALNRILADTIVLYDLYRKCQWLAHTNGLDQLQHLLGQHAMQQLELIDLIIDRIKMLGGVATTDPRRVAETTTVSCPPDGTDELESVLHGLPDVHDLIRDKVRVAIDAAAKGRPERRNDPILEDAFRRHVLQARIIGSYVKAPRAGVDNASSNTELGGRSFRAAEERRI